MAPHIEWIDEQHATGELSEVYKEWFSRNPGRKEIPGILKCFSQRPDFLRDIMAISYRVHFADGHLDRRTKELIATYVSALNRCRYCGGSHANFLQTLGQDVGTSEALQRGDLDAAKLSSAERELLKLAELLTQHSHRCQPEDIQRSRDTGWTDPQIAEAVYITALFAFFNRVANAFGLSDPPNDLPIRPVEPRS